MNKNRATLVTDGEPRYPIGVVAERTGVTPHVLRTWERRYGVVRPWRPDGGARLYSNSDILHFRLLYRLTRRGHRIGRIAGLALPELTKLLGEEERSRPGGNKGIEEAVGDRFVLEALEGMEGMDAGRVRAALTRAAIALSPSELLAGVVLPLVHQAGELWAEGAICPAHEHLVSVQVGRVVGSLLDAIPLRPGGGTRAVAATPSGQRHELGALCASLIAVEQGWDVTYLGPDLPAPDIVTTVEARGASLLFLSALYGAGGEVVRKVEEICRLLPPEVNVVVGGPAAREATEVIGGATLRWLPDFDALRELLRRLGAAA